MFFQIAPQPDYDFTHVRQLNSGLWFSHDDGWRTYNINDCTVYIKGYIEDRLLNLDVVDLITQDPTPKFQGNFIAIIEKGVTLTITHDKHRATPLGHSTEPFLLTNILTNTTKKLWADRYIRIKNNELLEFYFDPYSDKNIVVQDHEQIIEKIHSLLQNKIRNFLEQEMPIKIFLSGGIDTLTLFSYIKAQTNNFELCNYEHVDFTKFWCNKRHALDQYWGYKQIHLWKEPCVLVTGACGDENLLRSPSTINQMLLNWDLDLLELINKTHYHYEYLTTEKLKVMYAEQKKNFVKQSYQQLSEQLMNINLHDHQHWHIDNTLTYTPFKDLELLKLMLSLPKDIIIGQMLNAEVSKTLIAKNDPSLLEYLSNQKNRDTQQNLYPLYKKFIK